MQHQRSHFIPPEQRLVVEAAILALVLTEDWPWRADELAQRLRVPEDVIGLSTGTLHADGLLVVDAEKLRASWAAVRCDELAASHNSNECRARMQGSEAAIPLYFQ
jgi:hypothetical protein